MHLMKSLLASQLLSRAVHWNNTKQSLRSLCHILPLGVIAAAISPLKIFLRCKHHLFPLNGSAWLVSCCYCCMMIHFMSVDLVPFPITPLLLTVVQSDETCQVYWERGEGRQLAHSVALNSVSAQGLEVDL